MAYTLLKLKTELFKKSLLRNKNYFPILKPVAHVTGLLVEV